MAKLILFLSSIKKIILIKIKKILKINLKKKKNNKKKKNFFFFFFYLFYFINLLKIKKYYNILFLIINIFLMK